MKCTCCKPCSPFFNMNNTQKMAKIIWIYAYLKRFPDSIEYILLTLSIVIKMRWAFYTRLYIRIETGIFG